MSIKTQQWNERASPARLERRFEFGDYRCTREFLNKAAQLSERTQVYPDVSFGRTYVNLTLYFAPETQDADLKVRDYARELDDVTTAVPA